MHNAVKELADEIRNGHVVAFLGAGSSLACESPQGGGATGEDLARYLVEQLGEDPVNFKTSLMEVSEYLEAFKPQHRRALVEYVHGKLKDLRPTIGHLLLPLFPWQALITTNYNQAIENGFIVAHQEGVSNMLCRVIRADSELSQRYGRDEIVLFKPHGCLGLLSDADAPLVLTAKDYYHSTTKRRKMYNEIRELTGKFSTLFVGYSLTDYNFNNIFYELRDVLQDFLARSYSVGPISPSKRKYLEAVYTRRDIQLIDEKFDTFMINLADEFGLLNDNKIVDLIIKELAKPNVADRLGQQYQSGLPQIIKNELSVRGVI